MAKEHLKALEKEITALSAAWARLGRSRDLRELILIIRRPGWTTPAELTLVRGLVATLAGQTKLIEQTTAALMKGSRAVR